MAKNKVIYDGTVLIDLSSDTVSDASHIASGYVGHLRDGTQTTGTLTFVTYYTGSTTPSSSLGSDGDIYLMTGS